MGNPMTTPLAPIAPAPFPLQVSYSVATIGITAQTVVFPNTVSRVVIINENNGLMASTVTSSFAFATTTPPDSYLWVCSFTPVTGALVSAGSITLTGGRNFFLRYNPVLNQHTFVTPSGGQIPGP